MWRWFIILLLSASAWAQLATQEKTPLLRQSRGTQAQSLAYNANVVSGNLLAVVYSCFSGSNCATGPSIADTLGSTWHSRVTQGSTSCGNLWIWTAAANGSGADTVTITNGGSFEGLEIGEFTNAIDTLDVASTATGYTGGGSHNSPSITTTTNGALLISGTNTCNAGDSAPTPPLIAMSGDSTADGTFAAWKTAGAAGSTNVAWVDNAGGTSGNIALIAMKAASALQVVTRAIPNASTSAAYSFQLNANGGSGSYTWSQLTGTLPTGLSLSSAGVISGTATAGNSDATMTFRVTDGASTTADSPSLTLHVGVSVNTPAVIQTSTSSACSAFSLGTVTSGNLILINFVGILNKFDMPIFTDSQGTTFATLPIGNVVVSGTTSVQNRFVWGFAGGTGSDTLTCTGTAANYNVSEISNIQQIFDPAAQVNTQGSGGGTPITSGSLTLPVAELLWAAESPFTSTATTTAGTGFTLANSFSSGGVQIGTEYKAGASSGSQTASFAQTGNTDGHWSLSAFGFRPTTSGTAAGGNCAACDLSWLDVGQQPFTGF